MKVLSSLPMTIASAFTYFSWSWSWSFFSAGYFGYEKYDRDNGDMGIGKTAEPVFSGV